MEIENEDFKEWTRKRDLIFLFRGKWAIVGAGVKRPIKIVIDVVEGAKDVEGEGE